MEVEAKEKKFTLTARAVLLDAQGRCLLVRRSAANKRMVGQWEWPGGKVDPGEAPDVAVRRELSEETGLEVALIGFVGATSFEISDIGLTAIVLTFDAAVSGGTFSLSHEHDAAEWVPLAELSKYLLIEQFRGFMLDYASKKLNPLN
ncbi:MAG: NUDIX hydrolase [Puniceicoccales bacterium]|jgi:8-oxo-dGTP diphosphatase|nr:NUDIX hydrolase [Puniceicoccales bacterium]